MKSAHNRAIFVLLSLLSALLTASPCLARIYTWENFTEPFNKFTHTVSTGHPVIIEVSLPEIIKSAEEIPLLITAYQKDSLIPIDYDLIINDSSLWNAYRLRIPPGKEKTIKVKVKANHLKPGLNRLKFAANEPASTQRGLEIKGLRFDLSGKPKLEQYIASKQRTGSTADKKNSTPKSTASKDTTPPKITITSHDISRGMKIEQKAKAITISGRAEDPSGIVEVIVDSKEARLDRSGNFTARTWLRMGDNKITISAMDRHGNQATKTFIVVRRDSTARHTQTSSTSSFTKYYALVIGNNDYQYIPKLQTARKDASQVAAVLTDRYGFEARLLLDASRDDILKAINKFRKRLSEDDSFLVYYAGHGEFDRTTDKAYWLPVDARSDEDTDWIIVDTITSNIKRISSKHILIVSDSCYSGTLTRSSVARLSSGEARQRYLKKMKAKRSRTLLASGGNEPVSDSGGKGHSVFAAALLDGLRDIEQKTFTAEELFYTHIKERVAGNADQVPEYNIIRNSGHDGGDFIFYRID